MQEIKNLLNQVNIITKKNAEILDATGGRFNMFKVCGVNHYENTHSGILAEFLNPGGTHGLRSKLLECFIETLGEYFTIQNFNFERSRVRTEHSTEEGRIDILLEDNQNKAIIIENKIYALDQPEQLKRYNRYAQTYKNGYQIFYLTLFGTDASWQSCEGVPYLSISYRENIIKWLEKCVAISSRHPIVRETIIQYINHLKQLTGQDMDAKNKEEITEVLSKIENLRAARVISQNYSATFNYLVEMHFNPKMDEFAKQKGLEYHYEKSEETYVRFHLSNPSWQGKCWIGFTFEANRCHYGLCNNPDIYRIPDETRKTIHENLKNLGVHSRKESNWWPFYSPYANLSLETWEAEIIKSDIFLNDCKEKIEHILAAMAGITI
ncbi:PD-(D/E)XK nuclease family protein [Pedobacter agri]|uniref:PDDEXK-like family protein n=1 Tax=Pedobacter agri TaxID=454586 RepID=UPI002930A868|nr:PD-(D/E)XK nuclease family protein [Pedobacter agri]